jgi:hypothetical protein
VTPAGSLAVRFPRLSLALLAVLFGAISFTVAPAALASGGYDEEVCIYDGLHQRSEVTSPADPRSGGFDDADVAGQVHYWAGIGAPWPSSGHLVATNATDDVLRLSTEQSWGNLDTLDDHFIRHGADFGATSADDYAARASEFFQRAQQQGLPTRIDADGVIRIYDPATNTFGAYNATGTTRTFFTPKRGIDYWLDQPGVPPWSPGS